MTTIVIVVTLIVRITAVVMLHFINENELPTNKGNY